MGDPTAEIDEWQAIPAAFPPALTRPLPLDEQPDPGVLQQQCHGEQAEAPRRIAAAGPAPAPLALPIATFHTRPPRVDALGFLARPLPPAPDPGHRPPALVGTDLAAPQRPLPPLRWRSLHGLPTDDHLRRLAGDRRIHR